MPKGTQLVPNVKARSDECKVRHFNHGSLPDSVDAILIENGITADDRRFFNQRLGRQQAVEGVTMMEWERGELIGVVQGDRQYGQPESSGRLACAS